MDTNEKDSVTNADECPMCRDRLYHFCTWKPDEPTLTCSEVVERLAKIAEDCKQGIDERYGADIAAQAIRAQATAILHSWRERRVQELEKLLAEIQFGMDVCSICFSNRYDGHKEDCKVKLTLEWREQIRKGANPPRRCSSDRPHPPHTFGGRPMQYCAGVE